MGKAKRAKAGTSKGEAAAKRARFVEAYCSNGGNATQAAITAGYSVKSARRIGTRLSTDVHISAAIQKRRSEAMAVAKEEGLATDKEVMLDATRALRFDPALLYRTDGTFKTVQEMPIDVRTQLEGIEFEEITLRGKVIGRVGKVKFPKKSVVREQFMKHFGLFKADNLQKQPSPLAALPIELQQLLYDRLVERGYLKGHEQQQSRALPVKSDDV